jgi:hypothetical protein
MGDGEAASVARRRMGDGEAASVARRRLGLAVLAVCGACCLATAGAQAQQSTSPADELWRAYPLEQKPTTTAAPSASQRGAPEGTRSSSSPGGGSDAPWIVLAVVVGGAGALVLALVWRRRRAGPADAPQMPVTALPREAPRPVVPGPVTAPRRAPSRSADPVCQVRWSRDDGCFYVATTDAQGHERRLVESPPLAPGDAPPEDSREAQAAIRQLAKELRQRGWRPLRAKGFDFDERRWYARRFRWPTEAEQEAGAGEATRPAQKRVQGGAA